MEDEIFDLDLESLAKEAADQDNSYIWYVGTHVEIEDGISRFLNNLRYNGHILLEEPKIYDYLYQGRDILYIIFYKSLTKLEYLEYKYQQKVDNNGSDTL